MVNKRVLLKTMALSLVVSALWIPQRVQAADPVPPFIPADADWLTTTNYYRAMASVGTTPNSLVPVTENTSWSAGAYNHSCYMLYNGITHDELSSKPGYTTSGDTAGNNGNVAVSSTYGLASRKHIELWMTGPFHALGILRHNLRQVGFGKCDMTSSPTGWRSGATMNVISGLQSGIARPSQPILFPGHGTTTNLSTFVTESPNPLTFCGWSGQAGLPVIAMMPSPVTVVGGFSITGPSGPLQTCALYGGNTSGTARDLLLYDNAVTIVPRNPLVQGTYTVSLITNHGLTTWSFTVDPAAATGIMPIPTVEPAGPSSNFTAVTPYRFADSRINQRITVALGGSVKTVRVAGTSTGTGVLPSDITAISANVTVLGAPAPGHVTIYNCSNPIPTASSINYAPWETVPNSGVFPLSPSGDICIHAYSSTHLFIDINGYFRPSDGANYHPMTPTPLVNTLTDLNAPGRLAAGQTLTIDVPEADVGVPSNATAVAVIVSGIYPSGPGHITVYPCGSTLPTVSTLNPEVAIKRTNAAIAPLSSSGTLCLYTHESVDVTVDAVGYFTAGGGGGAIVPTTPTRVTDTRETYRPLMNLGAGGAALTAGREYRLDLGGERGIPTDATAVSLNVTAVVPTSSGFVRVTACGTSPNVASMTYRTGFTVATGMQVELSQAGEVCIVTSTNVHLVIDVTGYWS